MKKLVKESLNDFFDVALEHLNEDTSKMQIYEEDAGYEDFEELIDEIESDGEKIDYYSNEFDYEGGSFEINLTKYSYSGEKYWIGYWNELPSYQSGYPVFIKYGRTPSWNNLY